MPLSAHPRLRDLLELASGYGLILAVIWTPMPIQRILYWLAFAVIIVFTILRYKNLVSLGLDFAGTLRSLWGVAAALLTTGLSVFIARRLGTFHTLSGNRPLILHIWGYVVWAFFQEFLLQIYVLSRLLRLLPRRAVAIMVAALLFAVAHIPNPVLTGLTLLWGLIACTLFLRYRNLYMLGLAHGILGICVAITVPDAVHHHMRVGLGYLRYHQHHRTIQRSSAPQIVSTQACVTADAAILRSARQALP